MAAYDVLLRRAETDDAEAIADLYGVARLAAEPMMPPAVHTNAEDRVWFAARLAKDSHEAWVAEHEGELLGYALFTAEWLDHLFLRPDVTGQGIGTLLLDLVKSLRPDGFALWVFESNVGARRFYDRHGFVDLERTDGSGNEEKAPDVKLAWPGHAPLDFFRGLIDDVDEQLGDLLARRAALTRAVQGHKHDSTRDADREREIAEAMARRAPALGPDRLGRIVDAIITESLDAADRSDVPSAAYSDGVDSRPSSTPLRTVVAESRPDLDQRLTAELEKFNTAATEGVAPARELTVQILDGPGELAAGMSGWTWGVAAGIGLTWVSAAMRGHGLGEKLLASFEAEAKARGCTHVFVTSFTFQAPGFYEKHGYREIFRWEGVPTVASDDVHFRKEL